MHELDIVENRLQPGFADFFVKIIGKRLDINVDAVQHRCQVAGDFRGHETVADKNILQLVRMGKDCAVVGKLIKDCRFHIGVTDTGAAASQSVVNHLLGSTFGTGYLAVMGMGILRNIVILTVEATEVATHRGDGERLAAGQKVEQRFFFDGINIFSNQSAVHQRVQFAVPVFPHPADAAFSWFYVAMMTAQFTDDFVFLVRCIKHCLFHLFPLSIFIICGFVWYLNPVTSDGKERKNVHVRVP